MPKVRALLRHAAAAIGFACLAAGAQASGSGGAALTVSAKVRQYFSLHVVSQPLSIAVSAHDVARGYVDVEVPVQLAVESNAAEGYTIVFERRGADFSAAQVQGLGQQIHVASQGTMGWRPRGLRNTLEFRFRLQLAPQLAPGEYPWPVQVSMN